MQDTWHVIDALPLAIPDEVKVSISLSDMEVKSQAGLVFCRYGFAVSGVDGFKAPTGKRLKRLVQVLLEDHFSSYGHSCRVDLFAQGSFDMAR